VEDDALVLAGRCHPQESVPYKALDAVIDGLSAFLLDEPDGLLSELEPKQLNALARLFPVLGRVPAVAAGRRQESVDAIEMRQRGFSALRRLLTRIGERRPLVMWIDDLQWGDHDKIRF
jgi:predicted ATPase